MGCEEDRKAVHSIRREAQQEMKCWGCGVVGHCLWECPNKAVRPAKGKVQQKEVRSVGAKEEVKREWHWKEEKAARGGYLVERRERGWIEGRGEEWCAVSLVTCEYCGESGEDEGGNFVRLDSVHDMCPECEPYKDRLDREVKQERKFKNKCDICARKWIGAEKYKGICKICIKEGKKDETPKAEAQGEERVLRHTL